MFGNEIKTFIIGNNPTLLLFIALIGVLIFYFHLKISKNLINSLRTVYFSLFFIISAVSLVPTGANELSVRILIYIVLFLPILIVYFFLNDIYSKYKKNKTITRKILLITYLNLIIIFSYVWLNEVIYYSYGFSFPPSFPKISVIILFTILIGISFTDYLLFKSVFFPKKRIGYYVELIMAFLSGIILNQLLVLDISFYKTTYLLGNNYAMFYLDHLDVLIYYVIMFFVSLAVIFVSVLNALKKLREAIKVRPDRIDPVTIPRIKLALLSPTIWFFITFILLFLLYFGSRLSQTVLLTGWFLIVTLFIFILVIQYLSFQTPDFIKMKWRKRYRLSQKPL